MRVSFERAFRHGSEADRQWRAPAARKDEALERMKGVVASRLDRFAFGEAPLPFNWSASAIRGQGSLEWLPRIFLSADMS
jgi:hypothetical protein